MPEERKLVTVVFAGVVSSTAFGSDNDPEVVRSAMGSYFERMKGIAEMHGGTVEKFIGDAVMVVFGVPRLHEDDAERAVRAALAMRDAVTELRRDLGFALALRIGVNSGAPLDGEPRGRPGGGDELDDDLVPDERLAPPVLANAVPCPAESSAPRGVPRRGPF